MCIDEQMCDHRVAILHTNTITEFMIWHAYILSMHENVGNDVSKVH